MLSLFGVTVALYLTKILSGSYNLVLTHKIRGLVEMYQNYQIRSNNISKSTKKFPRGIKAEYNAHCTCNANSTLKVTHL